MSLRSTSNEIGTDRTRDAAAAVARIGLIAEAADSLKAENTIVMNIGEVTDFADYFVITTVASAPQMRALTRRIHDALREGGHRTVTPMEDESPRWSVLDYGDIVVHIFDPEARRTYQLEELWGDVDAVPAGEFLAEAARADARARSASAG